MRHIPRTQERSTLSPPMSVPRMAFALALAIMGLMLLAPRNASAQATAGITGTVVDTSGAVISGAHVTITNEDTAVASAAITGSSGTYVLRGLTPGKYNVEVAAAGFKNGLQKGVEIEVSTTATIDFALTAGAASETVSVTADQVALNTTQPELGSTIESVVVDALPEEVSGRGRQVDQLQFLAPGTTGSTFSHRISGGADFSQEILYNGIPVPQPETEGYTQNFNPPFDMVEEYKVERSTFSAQFGLGQGALTYQMKSGTNQYHGSGFEINRNSFFDSVGFFDGPHWNSANPNNKPPVDHENNYGFSIGGPIRIPHIYDGRNKTFGHYSQEWYKQNNENTSLGTVPTVAEKGGDFTNLLGYEADGVTTRVVPIYDPATYNPATGTQQQFQCNGVLNMICPSRFSAISQSLLQYIPDPDNTGIDAGGQTNNKTYVPFINPTIQHNWGFTVDHNLTPTQSLHYTQWRNTYHDFGFDQAPIVQYPNPLNSMRYYPNIGSAWLLNYSNAISSHLVVTAGFGWIGEINNQFNVSKLHGNTPFAGVINEDIPPEIQFTDLNHSYTAYGTGGSNESSVNRKLGIAIVNNWLWTKGRHSFNIGAEFRRTYQDDNEEQTEGGNFTFSHDQTAQSAANIADGNAFASFLLGLPDETNRANSQNLRLRNLDLSPYIQDDIKINPRLTVNLGLRWDIQVPFTEMHNTIVFFDPTRTSPYFGSLAGAANQFGSTAGFDRADIHWGHVGPRLGFAYQLTNKMVVQGGLDIAFLNGGAYEYGTNKVAVNYGNLLFNSFKRASSSTLVSSNGQWDSNPLPDVSAELPFSPALGAGTQINAFDKKVDGFAPYTEQWNINIQRELPWNVFINAAYVGNRIIHLPSGLNPIDQMDPTNLGLGNSLADVFTAGETSLDGVPLPYPNFVNDFGGAATVAQALRPYPQYSNIMNNFEGFGTTFYEGAQIQLEKRFTSGLSFLMGYTLSRSMDNISSGFSSFENAALNKYNQKPEWTISTNDEPQTLKASGTYELPIGPGKRFVNNHLLGNIVGGWQVGWLLDYESGPPIQGNNQGVYESGNPLQNGFDRPNRNPSVSLGTASYKKERDYWVGKISSAQMFNPAAFTATATQWQLGNAERMYSALRLPALLNENLSAMKKFDMGDHIKGILKVDYFNAFNRTQFQEPDNDASDATFGFANSTGTNGNGNATIPISNRQGQVQFRLEF